MCILYGGFTAWLLRSIAEPLWPPRKVCVSARLNVSVVKLAFSPGCASGCVCCASGCVCCDGFLSFFFTRLVGNSWNLEGGVAGVDLGKTILSTVRSHQTGYIGFISRVGQLKNACFARNEIQVFVQEWHSVIFLIMPAFILTSLLLFWVIRSLDGARHYFVTWNRSGTLEPSGFDELKDECGFWIIFTLLWITPPILSHLILHATFVKPQSFQTLRTRCMRSYLYFLPPIPSGSFRCKLMQPLNKPATGWCLRASAAVVSGNWYVLRFLEHSRQWPHQASEGWTRHCEKRRSC